MKSGGEVEGALDGMNDGAETPPAVTPEYQKAGWVGPGERPTLPQWKKCLKTPWGQPKVPAVSMEGEMASRCRRCGHEEHP